MNMFIPLMALLMFLFAGCSKDEAINTDCTEAMLIENDMIEYDGQDIGCKFFLELFHYKNKQYFRLGNHCADMVSYPTDCDGNKLCENGDDWKCEKFHYKAKRIGVIGIKQ